MATETTTEGAAPADLQGTTEAVVEHEVFPPFDPATFGTQLLWLAITFLILYLFMRNAALPRIGGILAERKARIDGDLAAADASRQKTDAAIAAYDAALAEARRKSGAIAEESRTRIKADIDARRHGVEADLAGRLAAAEASIGVTKTSALAHVDEIAAETAQALVERLTGPVTPAEARAAVLQAARG